MHIRFYFVAGIILLSGCTTPMPSEQSIVISEQSAPGAALSSSELTEWVQPKIPDQMSGADEKADSPDGTLPSDKSDARWTNEEALALIEEEDGAFMEDTASEIVTEPQKSLSAKDEIEKSIEAARSHCLLAGEFINKGESDSALASLDEAYAIMLKLNADSYPQLQQQKEEIRFDISKRILEIYAAKKQPSVGPYGSIPMTMNSHVEAEIRYLKQGRFFGEAYRRSGMYRDYIVEEMKKAGLPEELSWLPLIESGFHIKALSPARALGLWQFIPSTGYKFGLKRDRYIDERMDFRKSTQAAILYLKELHAIFGDWTTALAAYNCGEGRVLKVIRSQHVNYLDDFWDLYAKLPRETARYVPRFLATLHIIKDPAKHGVDLTELTPPPLYETVVVNRQISLEDVSKSIGVSSSALESLNPELKRKVLPPSEYELKIPDGKKEILTACIDTIKIAEIKPSKSEKTYAFYRIRKGDTLSGIAKRYRTSVKTLMRTNKIRRKHRLKIGDILKVPHKGKTKKNDTVIAKKKRKSTTAYTVKKGDSLWEIAKKYGVSTQDLNLHNKISSSRLKVGQVIRIPQTKIKSKSRKISLSKSYRTYRVKNGDVPSEIARRHNMKLDELLRINKMTKRSKIYPGQELHIE